MIIHKRFLPVAGLVGIWLLGWHLSLWLAFEVVYNTTPYTFNTGNVSLAGLQVLLHIVQHLVCPLQGLPLSHQLLDKELI